MADALPERVPIKDPESPTLQEGDGADDAANPAIAAVCSSGGVHGLRLEQDGTSAIYLERFPEC